MSTTTKSVLVLIVRLIIGGIFIAAGWMKISNMEMIVGFFGQMGLPAAIAYIVSYAELLGGISLVLGLWSCLASIGLIIIMLGAAYFDAKGAAAMNKTVFQAVMPILALIAGLVSLIASGAGRFALGRCCLGKSGHDGAATVNQ